MYPLVLVSLAAAMLGLWMAWFQPDDRQRLLDAQAQAYAANFWTYRQALVAYQNDNFQTTNGYVSAAALSAPMAYRPTGYLPLAYRVMQTAAAAPATHCTHNSNARDLWSNWFAGGRLYTFSCLTVAELPSGVVNAMANHHGRDLMIGMRSGAQIKTLFELDTPPQTATGTFFEGFPAQIPDGALVVIGN